MSLVVYTDQELSAAEAKVRQLFSAVPDRQLGPIDYSALAPAFTPAQLGRLRKIRTVAQTRRLKIYFVLPPHRQHFRSNPLRIWSFLAGHEGQGSLLSELIRRELALDLASFVSDTADYFTGVGVSIGLTPKGLAEYESVIEALFAYLDMLRASGLPRRLFDEIRKVRHIRFEFRAKGSALSRAKELSGLLPYVPPSLLNKASFLMEEFRPEQFAQTLELMTPARMIVEVLHDQFDGLPDKDPIFGTCYSDEPLGASLLGRIESATKGIVYLCAHTRTHELNARAKEPDPIHAATGQPLYSRKIRAGASPGQVAFIRAALCKAHAGLGTVFCG